MRKLILLICLLFPAVAAAQFPPTPPRVLAVATAQEVNARNAAATSYLGLLGEYGGAQNKLDRLSDAIDDGTNQLLGHYNTAWVYSIKVRYDEQLFALRNENFAAIGYEAFGMPCITAGDNDVAIPPEDDHGSMSRRIYWYGKGQSKFEWGAHKAHNIGKRTDDLQTELDMEISCYLYALQWGPPGGP